MQTPDYDVHAKLQAEVVCAGIKRYGGQWRLLPQYLSAEKRICCACQGEQVLACDVRGLTDGTVGSAWGEGGVGDFSGFCSVFSQG